LSLLAPMRDGLCTSPARQNEDIASILLKNPIENKESCSMFQRGEVMKEIFSTSDDGGGTERAPSDFFDLRE
jgi:hypothetical protein